MLEASTIVSIRENDDAAELLVRRRGQRVSPRQKPAKLVDHIRLVAVRRWPVGQSLVAEQLAEPVDKSVDMVRELFEGRGVAVFEVADDAGGRRRMGEQVDQDGTGLPAELVAEFLWHARSVTRWVLISTYQVTVCAKLCPEAPQDLACSSRPSEDPDVPRGAPRDARMTIRMTRALRTGIDRAAARDRRIATDWILRVLEDAVSESDAKAAKSAK
jgi:hypothetical protein